MHIYSFRHQAPGAVLAALAIAALVAACATTLPTVPPVATTGERLPGKVVWHDLVTPDLDRAADFYAALFGWDIARVAPGYRVVRQDGRLIGGMASLAGRDLRSYWMPLVSVTDVDIAVDRTRAAGGESLLPVFDLPGRGRVGVLRDPSGAAFAVVRTAEGDPPDGTPAVNGWLWHEVWTDDVNAAARFYADLSGYRREQRTVFEQPYTYLAAAGRPRVGLIEKPSPELGSTWVAYVRVADAAASAARAAALGGTILMAPNAAVRDGTVAIIADPDGAGLVLQEWQP